MTLVEDAALLRMGVSGLLDFQIFLFGGRVFRSVFIDDKISPFADISLDKVCDVVTEFQSKPVATLQGVVQKVFLQRYTTILNF